ncbi:MAG: hypothetical protein KAJ60_11105 [Desulfobulbaceae bacterium]|nr:hypothetical protein [Desulfobulbaceae bacterium]
MKYTHTTLITLLICSALIGGGCAEKRAETVQQQDQPPTVKPVTTEATKAPVKKEVAPAPAAGPLVTVEAQSFVRSENMIFIDVRTQAEAENGHIPGALNVPAQTLAEKQYALPSDLNVPVVLYGNNGDTEKVFRTLRQWGYINVSIINGGVKGWLMSGKQLIRGPIAKPK